MENSIEKEKEKKKKKRKRKIFKMKVKNILGSAGWGARGSLYGKSSVVGP
jgi:hypothetical protein